MSTCVQGRTDLDVERDVVKELRWDTRVAAPEISAVVENGIVLLQGTVSSYLKKVAAQEAAHRVAGVREVTNQITVKIPGTWYRSDREIGQAVRQALKWDVTIPDERVESSVCDGWVILDGQVDTYTQKQDADLAVRRLTGVRGLTNRIAVGAAAVSAPQLHKLIEEALERNAHREAQRIDVHVAGGKVTVSGTVRCWSEKRAVLGALSHTPGIQDLEDQVAVETTV
jgi:osmotically-inducible protein OsmY